MRECLRITVALGNSDYMLEHIGSTSVPDLIAKPVVDILLGAPSYPPPSAVLDSLQALGYELLGEAGVPGRTYLRRRGEEDFNVHVVEASSVHWKRSIALRNWLRTSPSARQRYEEAKHRAIASGATSLLAYSEAKAPILEVLVAEALRANSDA